MQALQSQANIVMSRLIMVCSACWAPHQMHSAYCKPHLLHSALPAGGSLDERSRPDLSGGGLRASAPCSTDALRLGVQHTQVALPSPPLPSLPICMNRSETHGAACERAGGGPFDRPVSFVSMPPALLLSLPPEVMDSILCELLLAAEVSDRKAWARLSPVCRSWRDPPRCALL